MEIKMVNQDAEEWFSEGYLQDERGDSEGAIASYDEAIKLKRDFYKVWYNRGIALVNLKRLEDAMASYDKAIEIKGDLYQAWYSRGWALKKLGRFEEAIDSFDKAIEIKPNYHLAWNSRGAILCDNLRQFEEAIVSFNKAIEIRPDYHEAWYNRGIALANLGQIEEAIASWDKTIKIKAGYHYAWNNRGSALANLGRFEDAIASYDQAIEFKPDKHEAWYNRGNALKKLGQFEEAIASFDKAIEFKPDDHEAWNSRGIVLCDNLGRYEEAVASFDKAIEFQPDDHEAWNNRGLALRKLGRNEEAIASYDQAIEFKPDFHNAWNGRGSALRKLGRNEEAIASYDQAIEIKPDDHEAWNSRGIVLCDNLGRFEDAIASFDKAIKIKPDYHIAWTNRSIAVRKSPAYNPLAAEILQGQFPTSTRFISNSTLNKRGYKGKLLTLETGLQNFQKDTHEHKLGRGRLHQAIGNTHYSQRHNKTSDFSFFDFCNKAIKSYNQALLTLTKDDFPEERLEVLQDYFKALLSLHQTAQASQLQQDNKDLLRYLLAKTKNPTQQQRLKIKLKLAIFDQLTVDILVQSEQWIEALETAEEGKNTCLYWLFSDDSSPKYAEIQQLLNPATAAVYWHLSPYALHTFIIKSGESQPIVIGLETESLTRLDKFEEWVKKWNQEYAKGKGEKQEGGAQIWRDNLEENLKELGNILNIAAIEEEVKGINNLILIPHRDLHRFPIHALFGDEFIISYLPSAKLGLGLAEKQTSLLTNEIKLLSIEHPESAGFDQLEYAQIESAAITALFPNSTRIQSKLVTQTAIETVLENPHQILHFTGHATYNFNNPKLSYLALAGEEKITIENLLQLTLSNYQLVTLSACETAITGNQTITTEYVGLVSAFISRGVSYVVSTLWVVESAASALIMIKFYRLFNKGVSAPLALKKAQKWLRNLTPSQLTRLYQIVVAKLPDDQWLIRGFLEDEINRYATIDSSEKLFTDPYHWSAFVITGLPHHL